ncbi:hypothetical protein KR038_011786 [Drosophila bunnanda]|nr:hypothetical protein KR038_011786 [Drosophila bunnanda]
MPPQKKSNADPGVPTTSTSRRHRLDPTPQWSRLLDHNNEQRHIKRNERYQVEIPNRLWSLFGNVRRVEGAKKDPNPLSSYVTSAPGRTLACCVMACCAGSFHSLDCWDTQLLDRIMVNGQDYHDVSLAGRTRKDLGSGGELTLENLGTACSLDGQPFWLDIEKFSSGKLYNKTKSLGSALSVFFAHHLQTGILQLRDQALAFGYIPEYSSGGAFFMFHCQAEGKPVFNDCETAPYVLRMRKLKQLLNCILITLDERQHNVPFKIHKVHCVPMAAYM